ncbi:MAG: glycosyltransferase family 9 protein [Candidatus Omnitrophota bacterium]|nr:MAG: glycosyltransferase family 9 protein [Candidatus Omnitrophota bacterium]
MKKKKAFDLDAVKMRNLDQNLGIPICLLLCIAHKIKSVFSANRRVGKEKIRKILVMKYLGMGSIILATPMIRSLRETFPKAKITFLTFSNNKQVIELIGPIDSVMSLRTDSLFIFAADLLRVLLRLRKEKYDIAIDMEFFSKFSIVVTYLCGAPIRVGYFLRELWREILLTNHVYYNHYKHVTEIFVALAQSVGAQTTDFSLPRLEAKDRDREYVKRLLSNNGINDKNRLVVLNVNAGEISVHLRRWPKQNFARLAEKLIEKYNVYVVFIGKKEEREYTGSVIDLLHSRYNVVDLAGRLSLFRLIALLELSSLLITNDSGPLHLAVAMGIPTVSFFGTETPVLFGPRGEQHTVFYKNLYCSPCLNVYNLKKSNCKYDNRCMKLITAEKVFRAIEGKYLKENGDAESES